MIIFLCDGRSKLTMLRTADNDSILVHILLPKFSSCCLLLTVVHFRVLVPEFTSPAQEQSPAGLHGDQAPRPHRHGLARHARLRGPAPEPEGRIDVLDPRQADVKRGLYHYLVYK